MQDYQFKIGKEVTSTQRKANFVNVTDAPYGDKSLGYSLLLPNSWAFDTIEAESAELPSGILKPLSIFLGPGNKESHCYFQLFGMKLVRDVRAVHWYVNYTKENNYTVLKTNELSHLFIDAIAEKEISGVKFVFRQVTRVDRDRLFFFQFFAPESIYGEFEDSFGLGVASFKLDDEDATKTVEARTAYELGRVLSFQLPASWAKGAQSDDGLLVDCLNTNSENEIAGWLRFQVLPQAKDEELLKIVGTQLAKSDVKFGKQISEQGVGGEPIRSNRTGSDRTFFAAIESNDIVQEVRIVTFPLSDSETMAVSLVGPSRTHDFVTWAINQRGIEIACESVQLAKQNPP